MTKGFANSNVFIETLSKLACLFREIKAGPAHSSTDMTILKAKFPLNIGKIRSN
jgi:hypothetical protein